MTFGEVLGAMAPLALPVGLGIGLVRAGVVTDAAIEGLSKVLVWGLLPALIFSQIVRGLDPVAMPQWWWIPLSAVGVFLVGMALTWLFLRGAARKAREVLALGSMQNAGYFVIALGAQLHPADFDRFSAYVFLFVLGYSPLLWSVGKFWVTERVAGPVRWQEFATPPLVASVAAVFCVLSGLKAWVPGPVETGIALVGSGAVPVALVVLGGSLARLTVSRESEWGLALRCGAVKMVAVPLVIGALLWVSGMRDHYPLLAEVLLLQAVSPLALNLVVHVRAYGGNVARVGTVITVSYLLSLVTIPFWLALWREL